MAKKRSFKTGSSQSSPKNLLRVYAKQYGIKIVAVEGLLDANLYDAKTMVDEFASEVLNAPEERAIDQVVSPETGVAFWMEWNFKLDPRNRQTSAFGEGELRAAAEALKNALSKNDFVAVGAIMALLEANGYTVDHLADGSYVITPRK